MKKPKNLFDATAFGRKLRAAINLLDLDQRMAAKQIGCSHSTVCRVCGGKAPDVENYLRIRQWLSAKHTAIEAAAQLAIYHGDVDGDGALA